MSITLYTYPGACSLSPAIALAEAKLDFTRVQVDFSDYTYKTEDGKVHNYRDVSESGSVPLLVLPSGTRLLEGAAIVQWIADQKPELKLSPTKGTEAHYQFLATLNTIATELHKGFGPLFLTIRGIDVPAPIKAVTKEKLLKTFARFDKRLEKQDYLEGDAFTVADGYFLYAVRVAYASYFTQGVGWFKEVDLSDFKNIEAWYKRMLARPAVQEALKREGLPL